MGNNGSLSNFLTMCAVIGLIMGLILLVGFINDWLNLRRFGKELAEPFKAEVIYQGQAVADLSDRRFVDMFWYEYLIQARSKEFKTLIRDDDLWDSCQFSFRDPCTGLICTSGFVGGGKPFVKEGRILLRALYFGGVQSKPSPLSPSDGSTSRDIRPPTDAGPS